MQTISWRYIARQKSNNLLCQGFIFRTSISISQRLMRYNSTDSLEHGTTTLPLSGGQELDDKGDLYWLTRAKSHGIQTTEQLLAEADFSSKLPKESRLMGNPAFRSNLDLWLLLLEINKQRDGWKGVEATWHAMHYRGFRIKLDPRNPAALNLLRIFISAGSRNIEFMWQFCKECIKSKRYQYWARFYVEIMASILSHQPEHAKRFSFFLRDHCLPDTNDIVQLLETACQQEDDRQIKYLCDILSTLPDLRVYDSIMNYLWDHENSSTAFLMHNFLLSRQDLPTNTKVLRPFLEHIARTTADNKPFLNSLHLAGVSFETQLQHMYDLERARVRGHTRGSLNILANSDYDLQPRKLGDATVARAFATTSFSFEFMLNSLRLFGLIEIGPLAARQMALTSNDANQLQARFEKLRELGIDTGSTKFVKILKRVCAAGDLNLVTLIASCDLHHDTFEDKSLQRKLLTQYYRDGDQKQISRTLAILNEGDCGVEAQSRSANLLLSTALRLEDFPGILKIIRKMRRAKQNVKRGAIQNIVGLLLPMKTFPSIPQSLHGNDRCRFVIGILQQLLASGNHVEISAWHLPLYKLGSSGRFDELEPLAAWVAEWYKTGGMNEDYMTKKLFGRECDLNRLFTPKFQRALIYWSFLNMPKSRALEKKSLGMLSADISPWLRGAKIIKQLRDKYGVTVRLSSLRRVLIASWKIHIQSNFIERNSKISPLHAKSRIGIYNFLASWASFWDLSHQGRWVRGYVQKLQKTSSPTLSKSRSLRLQNRDSLNTEQNRKLRLSAEHGFRDGDSSPTPDFNLSDVVVYKDLFHPSWEEYKK